MTRALRSTWPGWAAWALWTFNIFFLTSFPRSAFPRLPPVIPWDKIVHAIEWGFWGAILFAVLVRQFSGLMRSTLFLMVVMSASIGGAIHEIHQLFVPGRTCDVADWVADMIGVLLACAVAMLVMHPQDRSTPATRYSPTRKRR